MRFEDDDTGPASSSDETDHFAAFQRSLVEFAAAARKRVATAEPAPPLSVELYAPPLDEGAFIKARLTGRCALKCCSGYTIIDGRSAACACMEMRSQIGRFNLAQIPVEFLAIESKWRPEWSNGVTVSQLRAGLLRLHRRQDPSRVWHGLPGRGKSAPAAVMALAACRAGLSVRWVKWDALLARVKDAYSEKRPTAPILLPLQVCDLAIFDDLTGRVGASTAWFGEMAEETIGRRAEIGAPMLITTNLDRDEVKSIVGDRVASRLGGAARFFPIGTADSPDLRVLAAQAAQQPQGGPK